MQKTLTLKLSNGNEYEISFPTVGQFIDLEVAKQKLSKGEYGTLVQSGTAAAYEALEMIDIMASLTVFTPKLIKDMNIRSLDGLTIEQAKDLRTAYQAQFKPWLNDWFVKFTEAAEKK